jgi:hypothetical protein
MQRCIILISLSVLLTLTALSAAHAQSHLLPTPSMSSPKASGGLRSSKRDVKNICGS